MVPTLKANSKTPKRLRSEKRRPWKSMGRRLRKLLRSSDSPEAEKKQKQQKTPPPNISMAAEPTVRVPGIVLASLMFHHLNSDSDVVRTTLDE